MCTHSKFVIDFLISKFNWWACLLCVLKWSRQAQRFRMNVMANWLVLSKISSTKLMLTVVINEKVNIHTFILWFIHQHPANIMVCMHASFFMKVFYENYINIRFWYARMDQPSQRECCNPAECSQQGEFRGWNKGLKLVWREGIFILVSNPPLF